jgi:hypothetical protein
MLELPLALPARAAEADRPDDFYRYLSRSMAAAHSTPFIGAAAADQAAFIGWTGGQAMASQAASDGGTSGSSVAPQRGSSAGEPPSPAARARAAVQSISDGR